MVELVEFPVLLIFFKRDDLCMLKLEEGKGKGEIFTAKETEVSGS